MNEATIKPYLVFAVLCEKAETREGGGIDLRGIFDKTVLTVRAASRPDPLPPLPYEFTLATAWANGVGHFQERVHLVDPEGVLLYDPPEISFWLPNRTHKHSIFRRLSMQFQQEGLYRVQVLLQGELRCEFSWRVEIRLRQT